ncbi:MAG: hypothetical protein HYS12_07885 [Planctomycetes bacterium]|nr:hypothetical protein [Planctomycetota bacterium]
MSFRDFTLPKVQQDFGLTTDTSQQLFTRVAPVPLSETLRRYLDDFQPLGMSIPTEKGRSELLVAPLLAEVWRRSEHRISLYSGVELNVDEAAGLNGVCDFLLGQSPQLYYVEAPIVAIDEAKKDSIPEGLGQCASEMVAVQRFNQKANKPHDPVYGCVTTGTLWRFLRLGGKRLDIDLDEYQIVQADRILGVLLHCCGVNVA